MESICVDYNMFLQIARLFCSFKQFNYYPKRLNYILNDEQRNKHTITEQYPVSYCLFYMQSDKTCENYARKGAYPKCLFFTFLDPGSST